MPIQKLRQYLDDHGVKYMTISHSLAYTGQETAASARITGKIFGKTVMVKVDGKMTMAVLPASQKVDLNLLREALGSDKVELATEGEFQKLFPGCEVGAMPPFGNLFGLDVLVERSLTGDHEIAFNAGTHRELIILNYADFSRLVKPTVMDFSL